MRTFFGMVLGCLLTIAVVYMHDVSATSTITSGPTSGTTTGQSRHTDSRQSALESRPSTLENRQIVNWDVASAKWHSVTENARQAWNRLTANVS